MAINTGHGFDLGPIPDNWRDLARCAKVDTLPSDATEMSHRVCEQEVIPSLKAMLVDAEVQVKKMLDTMAVTMFSDTSPDWGLPVFISIDPVSGLDVRNVDIWSDQIGPVDDASPPGGLGAIVYPSGPYVPEIPVTLNMLNHADAILQAHGATVVDGELVAAIYRAMAAHAPDADIIRAIETDPYAPPGFSLLAEYQRIAREKSELVDEVEMLKTKLSGSEARNKILLEHHNKALARRPAAFVDPDEKPEHNPFREITKDRRMMGP